MPYNGSGVFNRVYSWTNDAANGIKIRADRMDADTNDITNNGLSVVLTRDGQGSATANQPMNGFQHTGAAAATTSGEYLTYGQNQASLGYQTSFGANISAAFGTTGISLIGNAFTQTDSVTGAGTLASAYASKIGAATFATPSNAITITNAYGFYFVAPVAGANVTLTGNWAFGADNAKINGPVDLSNISAGQIKFPASQNASSNAQTLDDYQEGTFSPTLFGAVTAGTPTYVAQRGNYRKIGNMVVVWGELTASLSGASGALRMGGFPYAQNNTATNIGCMALPAWGGPTLDSGYTSMGMQMIINTSTAAFYESGSGNANQQMGQSTLGASQLDVQFVGVYQTAT